MAEFNLICEPWIPCVDQDGNRIEHGIRETLLKAHELVEIFDESPLVTLALHRLLLAVLYRALEGPNDFRGWVDLFQMNKFPEARISDYLRTWEQRFYLFHDRYPFYQMANFRTRKGEVPVTRLANELSSGNNPTLFDHNVDGQKNIWGFARATRYLVAAQAFSLGFGKSGSAIIDGQEEELPYNADAMCLRGGSVYLQGCSLFETLLINLIPIPKDDYSQPPWEMDNPHKFRDKKLDSDKRKTYGARGIVDCYTWQSRLILLLKDGNGVSHMYFGQGRSADKNFIDPMKAYRLSEKKRRVPLSIVPNKASWRDIHAILSVPRPDSNEKRPECLNLAARLRNEGRLGPEYRFNMHVVGIATETGKAGKFNLWRHDRVPVCAFLLESLDLQKRLGQMINEAENASKELLRRTERVAKLYLSHGGRQPLPDDVKGLANSIDPTYSFWSRLEAHFIRLMQDLPNDWDFQEDDWKPDDQQYACREWRESVMREARKALEESLHALGSTARAIQAVAQVSTHFNQSDLVSPAQRIRRQETKRRVGYA